MSTRARYSLIAIILAIVLIGGGFAVWYFGFGGAGTALTGLNQATYSVDTPGGFVGVSSQKFAGGTQIPPTEVSCTSGFSGGQAFSGHAPGDILSYDYACTNHLTTDETFSVDQFDYDIVAWQIPPVGQSNGCKDQDDIAGSADWPDAHGYQDMLAVAQRSDYNPANADCDQLTQVPPPLNEGNQAKTGDTAQKITIPAGQTVAITARHPFLTCNYHQFDDYFNELDANGQKTGRFMYGIGDIARVATGNTASCPNAPAPTGDLQIRIFEDLNKNNAYDDPPAGEGAVFAGHGYQVFLHNTRTEIDYSKLCDGGDAKVGGAGRDNCKGLPAGQYDVSTEPPIGAPYSGPIKVVGNNPNGEDPYTVTVTAGTSVTADFGYVQQVVGADLGAINLAIYEDWNPRNNEYDPAPSGEGNVFFQARYKITNSAGQEVDYTKCSTGNDQVGGAGQATCDKLAVGSYTVSYRSYDGLSNNHGPDPNVFKEVADTGHNPQALQDLPVTVVKNQTAVAHFGFQRLVQVGLTCVATATPTSGAAPLAVAFDGTGSNPGQGHTMTKYDWAFGDNSANGSGATVNHTYTQTGSFTATLTVTNDANQTASCTVGITVQGQPQGNVGSITGYVFNDKNENGKIDATTCSSTELGYNRATVTLKNAAGTTLSSKDTAARGGPVACDGYVNFDKLADGAYTVCVDESDSAELDTTGKNFKISSMKRTTPAAACANVTLSSSNRTPEMFWGYNPRPSVQVFQCSIDKKVSDTTPANEGNPDDPKKTTSSPGETLTYTISWTCSGFVPTYKFSIVDTYDNLVTIVPGSITGGGVDNPAAQTITWQVPNSSGLQVASGSVSFKATIDANLAPGNYVLPNYVVMVDTNGKTVDQDQTETDVSVPGNVIKQDIEIIKLCKDVNGGTLLPNDVVECSLVVWNNGNAALKNVRVTDNMPPLVHGFTVVPPLPTGATDNSKPAPAGSNGTGFLDVSGFDLINRGDTATITFRITVDAGTPSGTKIVNLATAKAGNDSDTDEDDVIVGSVVPIPPTPPAPGPTNGPVPPPLGPRIAPPATALVTTTGASAETWALIASAIAAVLIAAFVYSRLKLRPE
ncbi:MAG: PKD domain-containing protein [Candidatus Andersenbacteria bacterium]